MDNLTVCDKFQPTILEGQLCYTLDVAKLGDQKTKLGKTNGILLLLDPNPYRLNNNDENTGRTKVDDKNFKIFFHTLGQHTIFGPGVYAMTILKKMTGTTSFKQLPDHQKRCHVHSRQQCHTQQYLNQVQKQCKCAPWALQADQVGKEYVGNKILHYLSGVCTLWPTEGDLCCKTNSKR